MIVGNQYQSDNLSAQVEIPDLAGPAHVRVDNGDDGSSIDLSLDQVMAIYQIASRIVSEAHEIHESQQFTASHPLRVPALADSLTAAPGTGTLWEQPTSLIHASLAGSGIVPLLHWVRPNWRETTPSAGWRLTLIGAETVDVGYAAWNDPEGIAALAAALPDAETTLLTASMLDPAPVARLSARASTVALRAARDIPTIDLKPVKTILADAGLAAASGTSRYHSALLRLLTIESTAGRKIPVAIAIRVPDTPSAFLARPTDAETHGMSRAEIHALTTQRAQQAATRWRAAAATALEAAGWRILDLPDPRAGWQFYGNSQARIPVLWATTITPEIWSDIAAAATAAAPDLAMQRGAAF